MISGDHNSSRSRSGLSARADAWGSDVVVTALDANDLVDDDDGVEPIDPIDDALPPTSYTDDRAGCVSYATLRAAHGASPTGLTDDDAYFHPGGRIQSITDANATLDGWRPEPTIVIRRVRARTRRSWLLLGLVALVAPLLLLVVVVMLAGSSSTSSPTSSSPAARLHTAESSRSPLASKETRSRSATGRGSIQIRNVQSLSSVPMRRPPRR